MTYDASNPRQVREAAKAAKLAEQQRREIVIGIMSLPAGRAWMLERLERCHVFATSHTGNALNTAFAEGERNIGLQDLNDLMQYCPDEYVLMMKERNERDSAAQARRRRLDSDAESELGSGD